MGPESVREYAKVMKERYRGALTKQARGALLDEFCAVTGFHRKAAIRCLGATQRCASGRGRGRLVTYTADVVGVLEQVWEASDRLCSKRLVGALPDVLEALVRHGEIVVAEPVQEALLHMSAATIDRRLAAKRRSLGRRPMTQSPSASGVRALVPVRTFGDWDGVAPGSCQADLVAHCGETTAGFYLTTLMVVDVATSWNDFDAVWGKDYLHVRGALTFAEARLPMQVDELHTDNGGEFLNYPLQEYCRARGIRTTRGRPYRKNDQAYVEQKNGSVIRRWVGYDRYSGKAAFQLLRRLYAALRLYVNHFQPVQRVIRKQRTGAKVHKTYDTPRTPYQRLLESGVLAPDREAALRAEHAGLNPNALRRDIADCQDALTKHIDHRFEGSFGNPISDATAFSE